MMKLLTTTIAAASVLVTFAAAHAGEPAKPWVPHTFSTGPINSTDRINAALAAQGQPPLGSRRIVYDDSKEPEPAGVVTTRTWSSTPRQIDVNINR